MSFHTRITVRPDVGSYNPTSFAELIGQRVVWPGLDPAYVHTLLDVRVEPDGSAAELTVLSKPKDVLHLDCSLRIVGLPPAYVRAVDTSGEELHFGPHPRPLQVGETVAIGENHYTVASESWPDRDPETGCARGTLDRQHPVLIPTDQPLMHPCATG